VNVRGQSILLLSGDTQPIDEESSYIFSEEILNIATRLGTSEVITIGGIGLSNVPKNPRVFCTGNCKDIIAKYKKGTRMNDQIFGVVGPIIGVSGLLVGLSKKRNMKAMSLLAETYGHPMYLGMRGAQEIVNVLNSKLSLRLNTKKFESQVEKIEEITAAEGNIEDLPDKKLRRKARMGMDTDYIG
jgi:proteasome assembly chaperone (PAC2) family protein